MLLIWWRFWNTFRDRELYGNNLIGSLPNELGNLTNLLSLDLYNNRLAGGIPETYGKLKKLRFLYDSIWLRFFLLDS